MQSSIYSDHCRDHVVVPWQWLSCEISLGMLSSKPERRKPAAASLLFALNCRNPSFAENKPLVITHCQPQGLRQIAVASMPLASCITSFASRCSTVFCAAVSFWTREGDSYHTKCFGNCNPQSKKWRASSWNNGVWIKINVGPFTYSTTHNRISAVVMFCLW